VIKDLWDFTRALCGETRIPDADRKRLQSLIPKPPAAGGVAAGPLISGMKETDVIEKVMKVTGKAEAGQPLFAKLNCANCHALSPDEKPKGPYLGDIGVRYQKAQLAQSLYQPSAVITQGYETVLITLDSGERLEGFVSADSGEQLELRNVQGEAKMIQKSKIKARKETKHSVMPDGILDNSSIEEFANLLAYLESLKGAKK
jgi:putative heme-binding domain-containing protein